VGVFALVHLFLVEIVDVRAQELLDPLQAHPHAAKQAEAPAQEKAKHGRHAEPDVRLDRARGGRERQLGPAKRVHEHQPGPKGRRRSRLEVGEDELAQTVEFNQTNGQKLVPPSVPPIARHLSFFAKGQDQEAGLEQVRAQSH